MQFTSLNKKLIDNGFMSDNSSKKCKLNQKHAVHIFEMELYPIASILLVYMLY